MNGPVGCRQRTGGRSQPTGPREPPISEGAVPVPNGLVATGQGTRVRLEWTHRAVPTKVYKFHLTLYKRWAGRRPGDTPLFRLHTSLGSLLKDKQVFNWEIIDERLVENEVRPLFRQKRTAPDHG